MSEYRVPSWDVTPSEVRYLCKLFIFAFIFLLIANAIVCRFLIGVHVRSGAYPLMHISTDYSSTWPAFTPWGEHWPAPKRMAKYKGPVKQVGSTYAVGWDSNHARYVMDVVHIGKPFNTIEIKKTLVTKGGEVLHANPPIGEDPQMRWKPFGVIMNPLIYASGLWFFIGLIPVAVSVLNRYSRYRQWAAEALCPKCGYDIFDLPICPECGTPAKNKSLQKLEK